MSQGYAVHCGGEGRIGETHDASENPHLTPQQKRKQGEDVFTCSLLSHFPFYSFGDLPQPMR